MTNPMGPPPLTAPRLRGDLAVWLVICAELLTFALLFIAFAAMRLRQPVVFADSQSTLDLRSGAINTVLLISGSACVAHAVRSVRAGFSQAGARWLVAAMACGAGFLVLKSIEYADKFAAGIDLETNTFWMFYIILTGFHFLHVAAAMVLLALLWAPTRRGAYSQGNAHALETGAAFWHMVDLLWIVLFPLVYVMR